MSTMPATQSNAITTFETAYGTVSLSPQIVSDYLKRGNKDLTEQEVTLFINLCKYQGLNPFVNEAYAIKFGDTFQMVIGYDAYKRRAYENPSYKGRKSGIVVMRGEQIIQKEGTCLYPSETLLGGWCRVFYVRNGEPAEEYREVSMAEFNRGTANWKTMPATMIEKVAVSQALRSAFPKDYSGLYTAEELPVPEDGSGLSPSAADSARIDPETGEVDQTQLITAEQRRIIFDRAKLAYGEDKYKDKVMEWMKKHGFKATTEMTLAAFNDLLKQINADLDEAIAAGCQEAVE